MEPDYIPTLWGTIGPEPQPLCRCQRCGRQQYTDSTGHFYVDDNRKWAGTCQACLEGKE